MLDENYEGAIEIERAWREGLTPDPLLTVSEWADRHRILYGSRIPTFLSSASCHEAV
jgi:hypothetical protein